MGRGRAKAKQTKVARSLKYQALDTDFDALQRELSVGERGSYAPSAEGDEHGEGHDRFADEDDPYAGEGTRSWR